MERIVVKYRDRQIKYRGRGYNPETPSQIVEYSFNEFQTEESFDFRHLLGGCNDQNIKEIDQTDNALIKESVLFPLNVISKVINKGKIKSRVIKSKEIKEKISYLGEKAENERKKESIECSPKNETKIDENKQIEKIDRDNKLPIKEENLNDLAKKDKTIEFLPKSELAQEFHKKPELNGETFKEKKHELFIMDDSFPIKEKFPIDTQIRIRLHQKIYMQFSKISHIKTELCKTFRKSLGTPELKRASSKGGGLHLELLDKAPIKEVFHSDTRTEIKLSSNIEMQFLKHIETRYTPKHKAPSKREGLHLGLLDRVEKWFNLMRVRAKRIIRKHVKFKKKD